MQECLCVLVVDDYEDISTAAQEFLEYLFSPRGKHHVKLDVLDVFSRFLLYLIGLSVLRMLFT